MCGALTGQKKKGKNQKFYYTNIPGCASYFSRLKPSKLPSQHLSHLWHHYLSQNIINTQHTFLHLWTHTPITILKYPMN